MLPPRRTMRCCQQGGASHSCSCVFVRRVAELLSFDKSISWFGAGWLRWNADGKSFMHRSMSSDSFTASLIVPHWISPITRPPCAYSSVGYQPPALRVAEARIVEQPDAGNPAWLWASFTLPAWFRFSVLIKVSGCLRRIPDPERPADSDALAVHRARVPFPPSLSLSQAEAPFSMRRRCMCRRLPCARSLAV